MYGFLKINHKERKLVMSREFAKYANNTMSEEYAHLQAVRRDYPLYTVVQRHIKQKETRECYRGLTYEYMRNYIKTHGTADDLHTLDEMKVISECHSKPFRYPTIKAWFLEQFPEVKNFGLKEEKAMPDTKAAPVEASEENALALAS